jgi:4a-hydroxytetrahydrobiopterin dehydratase
VKWVDNCSLVAQKSFQTERSSILNVKERKMANVTFENLSPLARKKCKACEGDSAKLSEMQINALLGDSPAWTRIGDELSRTFQFKNHYETLAFVNALAWISHREDHHPDTEVGYNTCKVRYSTHSVGGLSENDFICAAKVDALLAL